jgi:hypothetical protein
MSGYRNVHGRRVETKPDGIMLLCDSFGLLTQNALESIERHASACLSYNPTAEFKAIPFYLPRPIYIVVKRYIVVATHIVRIPIILLIGRTKTLDQVSLAGLRPYSAN